MRTQTPIPVEEPPPPETPWVYRPATIAIGLAVIAALVVAAILLMRETTYDIWGAVVIAPILIAVSMPILARQARREGRPGLLWFLVLALVLKLVGALVRDYVDFGVYQGVADARDFHLTGTAVAEGFRSGDFAGGIAAIDTGAPGGEEILTGSGWIDLITGFVYTVTGPTRLGGGLIFSWLGFWGLFLFYRAFRMAVPEGRYTSYARLLFFLPSLLFWPSSIGKEAWMVFTLGIAALGAAHLLTRSIPRGLALATTGLWLAALVRPHMAGILVVALLFGVVVRRPRPEHAYLAPVLKGASLAVLLVLAVLLAGQAERFLQDSGIETEGGLTAVLEQTAQRTSTGDSQIVPSVLRSPVAIPGAVATVLFRPFVTEADSPSAALAAAESGVLLLLTLTRLRWILSAFRSMRRQAYVALCVAFVAIFIVAFSGFANLGLLARERAQLLPFYLVLLTVPPRVTRRPEEGQDAEERWA